MIILRVGKCTGNIRQAKKSKNYMREESDMQRKSNNYKRRESGGKKKARRPVRQAR
jgi:hypothetical protein